MSPLKSSMVRSFVSLAIALCLSRDFAAAQPKPPSKSVKEACAQEKPVTWKNGLRYVEQFPANIRENFLRCHSTTAAAAKQHDTEMDAYRLEALKAILPKGTPPNKLGPTVCEITMLPLDGTNEVVKRKAIVTTCMEKELETRGLDTPGLDIKDIQAKCLKCAFPKLSEADALARYKDVVKNFESYEENAVRVNSELKAAMRFMIDEGPTKEMNDAARTECLKTMAPGVTSDKYMSHVVSLFKKGDLETKKKIDACTYKNSLKGKWVRARQTMIRECALEAQNKLPANLRGDLQFLYALHLNSTALEIYLSCAEREEDTIVDGPAGAGGAVDVYCTNNGEAPRKCPQCASEEYTTVDAAKVEATVDACYSKKEAAHPLYKQYTTYLGQLKAKKKAKGKCLQDMEAAAQKGAPARG
ncbi:uncharacterized protein LOC119461574 [Dermacentor silvarum]|uniref:uncharacterized protein LOC119461574 n=1 Tax=Dermacentor silvarum TaxID=543639 RepID=UPI0021017B5D|nr:uncharacterized protein LOC119461574 [Dermacentor silvarum]